MTPKGWQGTVFDAVDFAVIATGEDECCKDCDNSECLHNLSFTSLLSAVHRKCCVGFFEKGSWPFVAEKFLLTNMNIFAPYLLWRSWQFISTTRSPGRSKGPVGGRG